MTYQQKTTQTTAKTLKLAQTTTLLFFPLPTTIYYHHSIQFNNVHTNIYKMLHLIAIPMMKTFQIHDISYTYIHPYRNTLKWMLY